MAGPYYVAKNGNNSWDGLAPAFVSGSNGPWLTPDKVFTSAGSNSTIYIRAGTYAQDNIFATGKTGFTFRNYPGETVILQKTSHPSQTVGDTTGLTQSDRLWNLENFNDFAIIGEDPSLFIVEQAPNVPATYSDGTAITAGQARLLRFYSTDTSIEDGSSLSKNITLQNISVRGCYGEGIETRFVDGLLVDNCDISGCANGLTMYHTRNIEVSNCVVHDNNKMLRDTGTPSGGDNGGIGVSFDESGSAGTGGSGPALVHNNEMYNNKAISKSYGYDGGCVEFFANHDTDVYDNIFYDSEAAIETGSPSNRSSNLGDNCRIFRNLFYGQFSYAASRGYPSPVLLWRSGINGRVFNNTFDVGICGNIIRVQEDLSERVGYSNSIVGLQVKNNIVRSTVAATACLETNTLAVASSIVFDYNVFWNTNVGANIAEISGVAYTISGTRTLTQFRTEGHSWGAHDIWDDPDFVNPATHDYRLLSSSPAIDKGVVASPFTDGYHGPAPDIGRYELVPTTGGVFIAQDDFSRIVPDGLGDALIGGTYVLNGSSGGAVDEFERTSSSGWGNADGGGAWTNTGGSNSDYTIGSGKGSINVAPGASRRVILLATSITDGTIGCTFYISSLPTSTAEFQLFARNTDNAGATLTTYRAVYKVRTTGTVWLQIEKWVSGTRTTLLAEQQIAGLTAVAGTSLSALFDFHGSTLQAKVWTLGGIEPAYIVAPTDTSIAGPGAVGVGIFLGA